MKNVQFLRMAVTVSPYATVVMNIGIMCLDVNAQHQVIYIYDRSWDCQVLKILIQKDLKSDIRQTLHVQNICILMILLSKITLLMHPLTWSHWFSLQLHSDWQPSPNPGYIHCLSQFCPVYPIRQALNKYYKRYKMKNQSN